MKLIKLSMLFVSALLITACGGGGGGVSSNQNSDNDDSDTSDVSSNIYIWEEATPESVGMNSALVSSAFDTAFADGTYTQAALVIKDNKLVYERYRGILPNEASATASFFNVNQQDIEALYSSRSRFSVASSWSNAKSFVSVLIAIAIEQGHIDSLQQSASEFISEWAVDDRSNITVRNLLDMRSGLELVCFDESANSLGPCANTNDGTGGNMVFSDNQMSACINRQLAETGVFQPWYGAVYESGYWVYSNCDTMVLGELLFRATGQDLQTYADVNLFSKIGMDAHWWRDFDDTAQVGGNYLAYCCLDATPRDFAKFGQLLMNNGSWAGSQIIPSDYVDLIKNIVVDSVVTESFGGQMSYGLQLWTLFPETQADGSMYPPANKVYSTKGFDGQYIMMDFDNQLIVVRNSLYHPSLNHTGERRMKVDAEGLENTNFILTLPNAIGLQTGSSFYLGRFLYDVTHSISTLSD